MALTTGTAARRLSTAAGQEHIRVRHECEQVRRELEQAVGRARAMLDDDRERRSRMRAAAGRSQAYRGGCRGEVVVLLRAIPGHPEPAHREP